MPRPAGILKIVVVDLVVFIGLICLLEGFLSFASVGRRILTESRPIAERVHTEYDEEIGWINLPNVSIDNIYGPDTRLTTNSRRFRGAREIEPTVPAGKIRILCSGDSFTLGVGVSDDDTWCALLAARDERLETVNLGQGGYGVDQAYLWYLRNEPEIEHDVHLFAFISADFRRMQAPTFEGYGRPHLVVRDGEIVQTNRPISKRAYYVPWLTTAKGHLSRLSITSAAARISNALRGPTTEPREHTEAVAAQIFADLARLSAERDRRLVLVHLPIISDYLGLDAEDRRWEEFVKTQAREHGFTLISVIDALRALPPLRMPGLYDGHFSVEGNELVADILYQELLEIGALPPAAAAATSVTELR